MQFTCPWWKLIYGYSDSEHEIHLSPALFLTFDNSVVLASILILGGLIGPKRQIGPNRSDGRVGAHCQDAGETDCFPREAESPL